MTATLATKEVMDANTVTTIISNLNSLYSGAMGQVITYTAIVIGVVGILIPALSLVYQWRSLKAEKKSLEKNIQDGIDNAKLSIRNDLMAEMKEQISIEERKLIATIEEKFKDQEKQIDCAMASVFFLQGGINITNKRFAEAANDYSIAVERFIQGKGEENAQIALENLLEHCLPAIDKNAFEKEEVEKQINLLIKFLGSKETNINGRYTLSISKLKDEVKKVKARESNPTK